MTALSHHVIYAIKTEGCLLAQRRGFGASRLRHLPRGERAPDVRCEDPTSVRTQEDRSRCCGFYQTSRDMLMDVISSPCCEFLKYFQLLTPQ